MGDEPLPSRQGLFLFERQTSSFRGLVLGIAPGLRHHGSWLGEADPQHRLDFLIVLPCTGITKRGGAFCSFGCEGFFDGRCNFRHPSERRTKKKKPVLW